MDAGEAGKRDGMARARRHADPHWWQSMLECGKQIAEAQPYFYSDDVVLLCQKLHPNAGTHEPRAIGPLMTKLARLGYCVKTQDTAPPRVPQCHGRPKSVWWSQIYRGPILRRKPRHRRLLDPRQLDLGL